jgi:hypothetical protein
MTLTRAINSDGRLIVSDYSEFTDSSGRSNYVTTEPAALSCLP